MEKEEIKEEEKRDVKRILCISKLKPTYALENALRPCLISRLTSNVCSIECTEKEAVEILTQFKKDCDYIELEMFYSFKQIKNV